MSNVVSALFVSSDACCDYLTRTLSIIWRMRHKFSRNSKTRGDRWADGEQGRRVPLDVTHVLLYNQGILKEGTSHPPCSNEPCGLLSRGDGNRQSFHTTVHKECTKLKWDVPSKSPSLQIEITVSVTTLMRLATRGKTIRFSCWLCEECVIKHTFLQVSGLRPRTSSHSSRSVTREDETRFLLCPQGPPLLFVSTSKHILGPQNTQNEHFGRKL